MDKYGAEQGLAGVKWDIFIAISMDGFEAFKNKGYSVWPLAALMLNLPPHARYQVKNTLPFLFVPGPKQPKDLQSFLLPLVNELCEIDRIGGVRLKFYDGVERLVRVHLMWVGGDIPGSSKMGGLVGSTGKCCCRACRMAGVLSHHGHYYYPSMITDQGRLCRVYDISNPPMRTDQSIEEAYDKLASSSTQRERTLVQRDTGITQPTVLSSVSTIVLFTSFPLNIMHLFSNISKEMQCIWQGLYPEFHGQPFVLSKHALQTIDATLLKMGSWISSDFGSKPKAMSRFKEWKASDHNCFIMDYSLAVLHQVLPQKFLKGWALFVELTTLCYCPQLSEDDVVRVGVLSRLFLQHYEREYYQYDRKNAKLCKSVFHMLIHLEQGIRDCGSLSGASQFWMERYIGWIVGRLHSRSLAAASLTKNSLDWECFRIYFEEPFIREDQLYNSTLAAGNYCLLGPSWDEDIDSSDNSAMGFKRMLKSYLCRKYAKLTASQASALYDQVNCFKVWSRMRLIVGTTTQVVGMTSARRHSEAYRRPEARADYFVLAEMEEDDDYIGSYYGRVRKILSFENDVAAAGNVGYEGHLSTVHKVAVIEWAVNVNTVEYSPRLLHRYSTGSLERVFSGRSIEDVVVIKRQIGIAIQNASSSASGSRAPRTYFIDPIAVHDSVEDKE